MVTTLLKIGETCDTLREFRSPLFRSQVYLPYDDLRFNSELAMDLVWINAKPVLHVIDTHTCFQNRAFIIHKTAPRLWTRFVELWVSASCEYVDELRVDHEPASMPPPFGNLRRDVV